jgi:hypothetical protein
VISRTCSAGDSPQAEHEGCRPPWSNDRQSPILAIEQIPDHFASLCVHFTERFAFLGTQVPVVRLLFCFRRTALRTAIRKSRLIGPQLELFAADYTGFDWKTHRSYFIEGPDLKCRIQVRVLKVKKND